MTLPKILIIEDEENLGLTLKEYLESVGHLVSWADTAQKANDYFIKHTPDIVLMDIGLPDGNGLELARQWRQKRKDFVLLFLSALNDPDTKVEGLEIGAQDYITKPFALKELIYRLKKIEEFINISHDQPNEITHGPLKIWFKKYEIQDALGNIISLGQKDCAILQLLYEKREQAVDRNTIIEKIWGEDKFPSNRTIDNYIVRLRKWCDSDDDKNIEIHSIRGIGYKLTIKD